MSVSSTQQSDLWTGTLVAEGYSVSGKATVSLTAGTYYFEGVPGTFYYYAPTALNAVTEARKYGSIAANSQTPVYFNQDDNSVTLWSTIFAGGGIFPTTQQNAPGLNSNIIWNGSKFMATNNLVGQGLGLIAESTDFLKWELKDTGVTTAPSSNANILAYNADVTNKYVFCVSTTSTTDSLWTSTDSVTWTSRNLPVAPASGGPRGLIINANATNKYIVNLGGTASNQFCYSTDAVTWTNATFTYASAINNVPATNGTASTNEIYVYPGANTTNNLLTSTDGVTWTSRSSGTATAAQAVYWFDNKYLAFLASSNTYSHSTDGVTWTTATLPSGFTHPNTVTKAIIYDNKLYVPTSSGGLFAITTNGTTWTIEGYTTGSNSQLATNDTNLYFNHTNSNSTIQVKLPIPLYYRIYKTNDATPLP